MRTVHGTRKGERILRIKQCRKRVMEVDPQDLKLLQKAWKGLSAGSESERLRGDSALLDFITAYFYLDTDNGGIGNRLVTADILQSLQFIDEHLTTDISIDDIAFECALSTSRFKAKFKEQMGITPLYYINSLKINRAKEMLKNSDLSVIDIAFALGFVQPQLLS